MSTKPNECYIFSHSLTPPQFTSHNHTSFHKPLNHNGHYTYHLYNIQKLDFARRVYLRLHTILGINNGYENAPRRYITRAEPTLLTVVPELRGVQIPDALSPNPLRFVRRPLAADVTSTERVRYDRSDT
jgi:hypothetical protein